MLRITILREDCEEVVVRVEGWLEGSEVGILAREGERWRGQGRRLVLEVDEDGLALLEIWAGERLELRGGSAFVRTLLKRYGLG